MDNSVGGDRSNYVAAVIVSPRAEPADLIAKYPNLSIRERHTLIDEKTKTSVLTSDESLDLITESMNLLGKRDLTAEELRTSVYQRLMQLSARIKVIALEIVSVRNLMDFTPVTKPK
jgi:small-conductance mechanosensitive channel